MTSFEETRTIIRQDVERTLFGDNSGHGIDHIDRVYAMAMRFADELPDANRKVLMLTALLHDVDDYKLVGKEQAEKLSNATEIMQRAGIDESMQTAIKGVIANMGYSKALRGVRPIALEGMIVSDADMCDAIGASGTIRCLQYALSDKGSGVVFDPNVWPNVDITAEQYNSSGNTHSTDSFVNHHFEKLLKLPTMMMTEPGKREAVVRGDVMVQFLGAYFREQNFPKWTKFLDAYLISLHEVGKK